MLKTQQNLNCLFWFLLVPSKHIQQSSYGTFLLHRQNRSWFLIAKEQQGSTTAVHTSCQQATMAMLCQLWTTMINTAELNFAFFPSLRYHHVLNHSTVLSCVSSWRLQTSAKFPQILHYLSSSLHHLFGDDYLLFNFWKNCRVVQFLG